MMLTKEISPVFLIIPMLMIMALMYALSPEKPAKNHEICTYISGAPTSEIAELALSEGIEYDIPNSCIRKGALPDDITTFTQLRQYIISKELEREAKRQEERASYEKKQAAREQEKQRKLTLTLAEARNELYTQEKHESTVNEPLPEPPPELFEKVMYKSGYLTLPAFVSPDPKDNQRHPAIVWLTGGESNTLSNYFWEKQGTQDDQSAIQYREAGIVMMFPTLRGGNDNAGMIENNYGEVNDIIAATQKLASLPYVDPNRIYLGGHSTGGTLVLLVSEVVSQTHPALFRGIFSFGATKQTMNFSGIGEEKRLRAPVHFLDEIRTPTYIIEGKNQPSNAYQLIDMCKNTNNPAITCIFPENHTHFDILTPMNTYLAAQILLNSEKIYLNDDSLTN